MQTIQQMIEAGQWMHPDNYCGDVHFDSFEIGIAQTRDSETMQRCNFSVALEMLGGESKHVYVIRDGHWACGWVEHIRVSNKAPKKILDMALKIVTSLERYPVLNEDDFYELRIEEIGEYADQCTEDAEKLLETLTDLPKVLIKKLASSFAYTVVHATESECGEIFFDEDRITKIASGEAASYDEELDELAKLNGF